jgi:hypothetical protein
VPCSLNELVSVDMQEKVSFKKYANSWFLCLQFQYLNIMKM